MSEFVRVVRDAYREDFVCWASDSGEDYPYDHEHPRGVECDWGWCCNQDGCYNRTDIHPCSDHAPVTAPGLRLVECQASPRHWLFAHDRDDYGHGCPWCWHEKAVEELVPLRLAAGRRAHRWCWLWNPCKRLAVRAGVARMCWLSFDDACRPHVDIRWRLSTTTRSRA